MSCIIASLPAVKTTLTRVAFVVAMFVLALLLIQTAQAESGQSHTVLSTRSPLSISIDGVINQDTVWTLAGSPYILGSDVIISPGITLTIDAGVMVKGETNAQLLVLGRLVATGTPSQPITFTSNTDSGPDQWRGSVFDGDQASGDLQYVTVRYGGHGNGGQADCYSSNILVRNVTAGQVRIAHSSLRDMHLLGAYWCGTHYTGFDLYVNNSHVEISDTRFSGSGDSSENTTVLATGASTLLTITSSTFQDNVGTVLQVEGGGKASLTGSTFQTNTGNVLVVAGAATLHAAGNTIQNNSGWALGVAIDSLETMTQSGNIIGGNGQNRLVLSGGTMEHSMRLGVIDVGGREGYVLGTDLVVPVGITLTIDAGVTMRGETNVQLLVLGRLVATGTASQPITFTSNTDSGPDQWRGLVFDGDQASGDLQYVTVRYGGHGNGGHADCYSSNILVRNVTAGQVRIAHSSLRDMHLLGAYWCGTHYTGFDLYVDNSHVEISDTRFSGSGDSTENTTVLATGASTLLTITSSTFQDNVGTVLQVEGGGKASLTGSTFQTNTGNVLVVAGAATLHAAGNTIQNNSGWALGVAIDSLETMTQSGNSIGANGQNRLVLSGGTMEHSMRLGAIDVDGREGYVLGTNLVVPVGITLTIDAGVTVRGERNAQLQVLGRLVATGTPSQPITFTSNTDSGPNQWRGLVFDGDQASGDLQHVTVRYGGNGIRVMGGGTLVISDSTIQNNSGSGIQSQNSHVTVNDCTITGNTDYGIENLTATPVVLATQNWWGHITGPRNPDTNPDGLGDVVGEYVTYDPWLLATPGSLSRQATSLLLNQAITGTAGTLNFDDYSLVITTGMSLLVDVSTANPQDTLWVYGRMSQIPTWGQYDWRTQIRTQDGLYELAIPDAQAGVYYFSIYGRDVPGGGTYQLRVTVTERHLSDITPRTAGGDVTLNVSGVGFEPGMQVQLTSQTLPTITANSVEFVAGTSLWAHVSLTSATPGLYSVRAIWLDGHQEFMTDVFTVSNTRIGARLEMHLEAPTSARPGRRYALWLDYANTGDAEMPAPIFVISSTDHVPLSLLPDQPPEDHPVQILASDGDTCNGHLSPGASGRVPIYLHVPATALAHQDLRFSYGVLDNHAAIDWSALEIEAMSPDANPEAWAITWPTFRAGIGNTWGDYQIAMDNQATYFARYGAPTCDLSTLFSALLSRSVSSYLALPLAESTDASIPGAGAALTFQRTAEDDVNARFTLGPLGRGWSHNYQYSLVMPDPLTAIVLSPDGGSRRFTRLAIGQAWRASAGDAATLATQADGSFKLQEMDGQIRSFTAGGLLAFLQDANGNRVVLTYTAGLLTGIGTADGRALTLEYNAQGRIQRLTDQTNQSTVYTYDGSSEHLLSVTAPGGATTVYAYQPVHGTASDHALSAITYPDATHFYYSYDEQGRLSAQWRDGGAERVEFRYDALGTVYLRDATSATTTIRLGMAGSPIQIEDPDGRVTQLGYDDAQQLTRQVQPGGGLSTYEYDDRGNQTGLRDPLGASVDSGYTTDLNQMTWLRDSNHNLTSMTHDNYGNLTSMLYPDGSTEQYSYDTQGNRTVLTNRRGASLSYTFDARGQVISKDYPDGRVITYTYDTAGNLITAGDTATGIIHYGYDTHGYLDHIVYADGRWLSFVNDEAGKRLKLIADDGYEIHYAYDSAGRLQRLADAGNDTLVAYEYDGVGRLSREQKGNGTMTTYQYAATGQVLKVLNLAPDSSVQSRFDYTYDADGNRTSMTTVVGTTDYGYDAKGQLISVVDPNGRQTRYVYDAGGNRVVVTADSVITHYSLNGLNQYTQVGAVTYAYDADGNMISSEDDSGTSHYDYDVENHLVHVTLPSGESWTYTYDAMGNRASATHDGVITRYVNDPQGLVDVAAEYSGDGSLVARYIHGLGLVARVDDGAHASYYSYDATGNTRQVSGESGAVQNNYSYDSFGILLSSNEAVPNPFRYGGKFGVLDAGYVLNTMRARMYDPTLGRFRSADPLKTPLSNLYAYAENNPIVNTDPSGESTLRFAPDLSGSSAPATHGKGYVPPQDIIGKLLLNFRRRSKFETHGLIAICGIRGLRMAAQATDEGASSCGAIFPVITPGDPNEKVSSQGTGVRHLVNASDPLAYTIYFENVPTATAPAQEVFVTDQLDPSLDWQTFEVSEVTFGGHTIATQDGDGGQSFVRASIPDYRSGANKSWWVDISAQVNYQTGQVDWVFRTLDPETGELPEDALAGFLPPDDATGRGEGHVTFTIRPRIGITDGQRISNTAVIVFDTNEPMSTNEVWNTLMVNWSPSIILTASPAVLVANGVNTTRIQVLTRVGVVPGEGQAVTLTTSAGHFSPGGIATTLMTGTSDSNGVVTATVVAPSVPGTAIITATTGVITRQTSITFTAPTTGLVGRLSRRFGAVITYTWIVTNLGPTIAYHVVLTSAVPANTRVLTDRIAGGILNGSAVITSAVQLAAGGTFTVAYAVEPLVNPGTITAWADARSDSSEFAAYDTSTMQRVFIVLVLRK